MVLGKTGKTPKSLQPSCFGRELSASGGTSVVGHNSCFTEVSIEISGRGGNHGPTEMGWKLRYPENPMLLLPELKVLLSFYEIVRVWSACGSDGTKPWKLSSDRLFSLAGYLNDMQMLL